LEEDVFNFELDIDESLQKECFLINEDFTERAIINLLNNSIKHNPKGCNIQIKLYKNEKNAIVLSVEDNGAGVSRELLKKLNKKSYETERSEGNHGLGLKIVKQVASRHKWKISFHEGEMGGFVCEMILKN
jgi:two-component sensor histidine kinase